MLPRRDGFRDKREVKECRGEASRSCCAGSSSVGKGRGGSPVVDDNRLELNMELRPNADGGLEERKTESLSNSGKSSTSSVEATTVLAVTKVG
jgi:hypothetical protein